MMCAMMANAQRWYEPADSFNLKRGIASCATQGTVAVGTMAAFHALWYAEYRSGKFHTFNDINGWMQMDKAGHLCATYQVTNNLYQMNRWTGMNEHNSLLWSAGVAYGFQTFVELEDGFSTGWGWSWWDIGFNTLGTAAYVSQQLGWKEQRIALKYSFWPSQLNQLGGLEGARAKSLYGAGIHEQVFKDYNGQTYWLSANIWSIAGKPSNFPKWLNVAAGYSVNNVLGAESNTWKPNPYDDDLRLYTSSLKRERQWLLSLDVDLSKADLPKQLFWMRSIFGVIKLPFPALEINSAQGFKAWPIYF